MKTIYEYLEEYRKSDYYGFHMPGHKRNEDLMKSKLPYGIDITEIEGFDDLHHADGIIKEAQERAARLYHADETHFLVNGSTVGILSAIMGATRKGDKILVARNCHKSVYNAIFMQELMPVYLYPEHHKEIGLNGEICPEEVQKILEQDSDIKVVMIVSPTYDGVVSDIEKIAEIVHNYGAMLIVDEAHGAHFSLHPYFPENANVKGADIVIHSVHKTLPSLTQTALLHMNGMLVNRERIRMYLHMLQSSSPSYVLMASIDECLELLETEGVELFSHYVDNLCEIRKELGKLQKLQLVETRSYDKSKLVISVRGTNLTSRNLSKLLLEKYHLQMEMTAGDYVLAMTSVGDTKEGLQRFLKALKEIDSTLEYQEESPLLGEFPKAEVVCKSSEVLSEAKSELVLWEEAVGKVTMEYAYLYPPGVPIVVPGERVTEKVIKCLNTYRELGFAIEGLEKEDFIKVTGAKGDE